MPHARAHTETHTNGESERVKNREGERGGGSGRKGKRMRERGGGRTRLEELNFYVNIYVYINIITDCVSNCAESVSNFSTLEIIINTRVYYVCNIKLNKVTVLKKNKYI